MLTNVLIVTTSIALNFLLVYLAVGHFRQLAYSVTSKQGRVAAEFTWLAQGLVSAAVIGGAFIYFTAGAESIYRIADESQGSSMPDNWLTYLCLTNLFASVVAAAVACKRVDVVRKSQNQ